MTNDQTQAVARLLLPLIEALRADPSTVEQVERALDNNDHLSVEEQYRRMIAVACKAIQFEQGKTDAIRKLDLEVENQHQKILALERDRMAVDADRTRYQSALEALKARRDSGKGSETLHEAVSDIVIPALQNVGRP